MKNVEVKQEEVKLYEAPAVVYETEIQTRAGSPAPLVDPGIDVDGIFND